MNVTLLHHTTGVVRNNFDVNRDKILFLPPSLSLPPLPLALSLSPPPSPSISDSPSPFLPSSLSYTYTQIHTHALMRTHTLAIPCEATCSWVGV